MDAAIVTVLRASPDGLGAPGIVAACVRAALGPRAPSWGAWRPWRRRDGCAVAVVAQVGRDTGWRDPRAGADVRSRPVRARGILQGPDGSHAPLGIALGLVQGGPQLSKVDAHRVPPHRGEAPCLFNSPPARPHLGPEAHQLGPVAREQEHGRPLPGGITVEGADHVGSGQPAERGPRDRHPSAATSGLLPTTSSDLRYPGRVAEPGHSVDCRR